MTRFDGTLIPEQDAQKFRDFVDNHRWTFAKTYAAFCPHEYTLRWNCNSELWSWAVKFIWDNGFDAWYGANKSKYFIVDDWYYFVFPADVDESSGLPKTKMSLINRASLKEFEFVEELTLYGVEYRVKRLPKDRRG